MKKVYTKPVVVIEKFEVSEHIAACGNTTVAHGNYLGTPNYANGIQCEFVNGDGKMFLFENNECIAKTLEDNPLGCYNTPTGPISFFAS